MFQILACRKDKEKLRVLKSTELKILSWAHTTYNPDKWPYKYSEMGNWGERNPTSRSYKSI